MLVFSFILTKRGKYQDFAQTVLSDIFLFSQSTNGVIFSQISYKHARIQKIWSEGVQINSDDVFLVDEGREILRPLKLSQH